MIKFFRNIRQKTLTENPPAGRAGKFSKYILYAIGEIILVVIGILIALSINNWNEVKKKDEKFDRLLTIAQKELQENITEIDKDTPSFMRVDSLVYLFKNNLLNQEMLDSGEFPAGLGFNRTKTSIENDAYKNLIDFDYELNKNQDSIIRLLKSINVQKKLVDDYFDYLGELISSELLNLAKTKGWYNLFIQGKINKEMSKYFLSDSIYSNYLAHFSNYYFDNYATGIQETRYRSSKANEQISKYFNKKDTLFDYKVNDYKHYIGVYKDSIATAKIEPKNDKLIYAYDNGRGGSGEFELYPISQTSFTTSINDGFYYLILDDSNKVISHRWSLGLKSREYLKVE
jgi:hypothetical protein